jgi:hypothetical protein
MGTAIGMWICLILSVVSFLVILINGSFIGAVVVAFIFVIIGITIFNTAPEEQRKRVADGLEYEKYQKMNSGYKCPSCGKMAGHEIGALSKSVSVGTMGLASNKIGKTYKCANCDYMW